MHSLNIVHRDIKPENLLLDTTGQHISLKLIDFGISNCYNPDKLLTTPCGTASYAPPEMHKGEEYYGLLSDVWSAGVVLYAMVFGYLPFCEDDEDTNINNIIGGNYEIPEEASPELADLLLHLLDINPLTRYDLEQIKKHPWFNIAKTYTSVPGVIEGYHRIPVDMKVIEACEQYGYERDKVINSVEKCKYNRNSSVYYILLSKMKREGYKSISDLYSDKFLEFINNPRNVVYRIEDRELFGNDGDKDINNFVKINSEGNINEKIKRHQSHPINDKNFEEELLSFKENDNTEKRKKEKEKNTSTNTNPADINNIKNNNFETINNDNDKSNHKYKTKKNDQKSSLPIYIKPKVNRKKNRNDKFKDFDFYKEVQDLKNITINNSSQTNKSKRKINNMNHSTATRRKNNKKEEIKKPIIKSGNNRSFSQAKKNKIKKGKRNSKNDNNITNNNNTNHNNYKTHFPEFNKKPENNALKTEIIRKNLNEKMIPLNSFHLLSKTKEILNQLNNNEVIDVDFMNTSFTKKLSDDVKEKILKLKNPKKNVPEKQKKINNALLSLKMKKQKKKGINNNFIYNYNSTGKTHNKNKKINIKSPIFKDNNRKDHTLIHNRNASVRIEHRNHHKNMGSEGNRNQKDISLSPNQDRRNIINIYVQTKNNVNSNNVYNINLITKNNYSIENPSTSHKKRGSNYRYNNHNNSNIKVKKTKISRQKLKSIDEKLSVNSNHYLNTTNLNSSFANRNFKYGFQTPNKMDQNLYFEKPRKVLSNSTIQYPNVTNNYDTSHLTKKNNGRSQSQKNYESNNNNNIGHNKKVNNKPGYNNSFNDYYYKNKKAIRLSFNPIEEKDLENLEISQNLIINKINSNQKISKINSSKKNSARVNNKYRYHYKSRSLMDNENPMSFQNLPNNTVKNRENNFTNNNYLLTNNRSIITDNQKITKIKSTRCASVKPIETNTNNNTNYNYSNKLRQKLINISFVNLHKNDNKQISEPRKYNGPVDIKCILVTNSIDLLIEKISNLIKKNKITKTVVNPYKMKCSKKGENFEIEFFRLNNNIIKFGDNESYNVFNYYNESSYSHDNDIKYNSERKTNKNLMLYYFSVRAKKGNNKNISKMMSKMICSKFSIIKSKK